MVTEVVEQPLARAEQHRRQVQPEFVPSPIIALNRAIAVAELDGPEVALAAVDRLEHKLAGYHAYHAARADLLRRLGRSRKSHAAYDKAIELAGNTAETASLTRRRDQLG
jgi:RNA polymerase sigma-70 factor, ECF subfamily